MIYTKVIIVFHNVRTTISQNFNHCCQVHVEMHSFVSLLIFSMNTPFLTSVKKARSTCYKNVVYKFTKVM